MEKDNPFPVNGYRSPQLFCDRESETATLTSALRNGRHVMLYSPRRYGKTGLIQHVFNGLARVRGHARSSPMSMPRTTRTSSTPSC